MRFVAAFKNGLVNRSQLSILFGTISHVSGLCHPTRDRVTLARSPLFLLTRLPKKNGVVFVTCGELEAVASAALHRPGRHLRLQPALGARCPADHFRPCDRGGRGVRPRGSSLAGSIYSLAGLLIASWGSINTRASQRLIHARVITRPDAGCPIHVSWLWL